MTTDSASPTASVLVVERSTAIQRLFEVVLRDVADRVFLVAEPQEARELLATESIDLVILEPQGSYELQWELLEHLATSAIPAVVVTSRVDERVEQEAIQRGATAFVAKPFLPEALQAIVRDLVRTHST